VCANKVVDGVHCCTLPSNIRPQKMRQFASPQQIEQLEGLAVARPWGFDSPSAPKDERPSIYWAFLLSDSDLATNK
jgi:hypothetical protein